MTCGELREYLFAFLDSELDAARSMEVQLHLEQCPACAREVEIERAIRRTLDSLLSPEPIDAARDEVAFENAFRRVIPELPHRPGQRRRRLIAGAVLACAAAVLLIPSAWPYLRLRSAPDVSDVLVADFEHFLEKGKPLQLASAEPAALSDWLHEATGLSVVLPPIDLAHGRLVGARKCKLQGRPAAFALYEMNGTPASLIVMPAQGIDLDVMKQVSDGPHTHWIHRRDGHTVLACRRGELLYAAVSTLGEEHLARLMANGSLRD